MRLFFVFLFVFKVVANLIVHVCATVHKCPEEVRDFNKSSVYDQLTKCNSIGLDDFREENLADNSVAECAYELNIAPVNLMVNIERAISKNRGQMKILSACLQESLIDGLQNIYLADMKSLCLRDVCRHNHKIIYPLYCYGRRKCDPIANDWFFGLIYAQQQLRLEKQKPIGCDPSGKFDPNDELFRPYSAQAEFFREGVCQNVAELSPHVRVKRAF